VDQLTLLGPPEPVRSEPCEVCGGVVVYQRTANPFEDVWRCTGCQSVREQISWSREFGPRFEEVKKDA
jgi:hypothetical protein